MAPQWLTVPVCVLLFLTAGSQTTFPQSNDPHDIYEQNCGGCHTPHAGDFVQENLARLGVLTTVRRSGEELRPFLERGHGNLSSEQIDVTVKHLSEILEAGGLFRERCLICHGRAVTFARSQLIMRDGRIVARFGDRDIEAYLRNHGRLDGDQRATIIKMLERQLSTQPSE
jgi:hypothetical protein